MHEPSLVLDLLVVIFAAAVGGALFEWLRLPAVVGFLVVGAIVGPNGLSLIKDTQEVHLLAEYGVAFLLFEIGLEFRFGNLRRTWRWMFLSGALQVVITVGLITLLCIAVGLPPTTAVVMGMLVSLSSTALVIRMLSQRDEIAAPYGRLALGILLFQDLCIIPFLLAIPILASGIPEDPTTLITAIGRPLLALLILIPAARFLLPWVLRHVVLLRSPDLFSIVALLLAIGSAVAAETLGLSMAVGAFIAGLVLSASPFGQRVFAEVAPWRGVLLGAFFTSIGMLLDIPESLTIFDDVALYLGGVLVLKTAIIVTVLALVLREELRFSIQTGLALAQTGEFSFVLAATASAAGLLDPQLTQVFIAGSVLSLVATPLLIAIGPRFASWASARIHQLGFQRERSFEKEELIDHIVIIGFGLTGQTLARILRACSIPYRVMDSNPRTVSEMAERGEPIEFGDATRPLLLTRLGVQRARAVVLAISDRSATLRCVSILRTVAPTTHVVARTRYVADLDLLLEEGASEVVAEEFESMIDLFGKVLRLFGTPPSSVTAFSEGMRQEGYELLRGAARRRLDPWLAELLQSRGGHIER